MTGQIIENGVSNFTPIIERLGNIATEIIPYMIHITMRCAIVYLGINATKRILEYMSLNSMKTFRQRENRYRKYRTKYTYTKGKGFRRETRYERKKPKRYQF